MRTTTLALLYSLALATTGTAQKTFGLGGMHSFASRGTVGAAAGELHQGFHNSHHAGLGDLGTKCAINGVRFIIQDREGATRETVSTVFRKGTDGRGPGAQIARIGPLTAPAGRGPVAWLVTQRFSAPMNVPNFAFFSTGVAVTALRFGGDGAYLRLGTVSSCAHTRTPNHAWELVGTTASQQRNPAAWGIELLLDKATVLQHNNSQSDYGMAGMFPKTGCQLHTRVHFDTALSGGKSLLYGSLMRTRGFALFPGTARLYLGSPAVLLGTQTIDSSGRVQHTLTRSVPRVTPGPTLFVQAAGVKGATVALSNTQGITP